MSSSAARWRQVPLPGVLAGAGAAAAGSSSLFGEAAPSAALKAAQPERIATPAELRARRQDSQLAVTRSGHADHPQDALQQLDKAEEERDLVAAAAERWEEELAEKEAELAARQSQLQDLQQQRHVMFAQETATAKDQGEMQKDLLEKQLAIEKLVQANKALENSSREAAEEGERLHQRCEGLRAQRARLEEEIRLSCSTHAAAEEELCTLEAETSRLQAIVLRLQEEGKAQADALEQQLERKKKRNLELLKQIQHNEVQGHHAVQRLRGLNEHLAELAAQRKELRRKLETAGDRQDGLFHKEQLEEGLLALRRSLQSVAEQELEIQGLGAKADEFRQLDDKLFAVLDQIRKVEHQLGRQEQKKAIKEAKIKRLENDSGTFQQDLQTIVDMRMAAESEAHRAASALSLVSGRHDRLSKALRLVLAVQDRMETRLRELTAKASALEISIEHAKIKLDGNEEDKSAMRYELRRVEGALRKAAVEESELLSRQQQKSEEEEHVQAERAAIRAEIDFIRREDMLDDTGRTLPIVIESESKLIERLEINEFLVSAQQARKPVPLLVGKIAHILELLQQAYKEDCRLQEYVIDARERAVRLRRRNRALKSTLDSCEVWKTNVMLKIVSNEFEARRTDAGQPAPHAHVLHFDNLELRTRQLEELPMAIRSYGQEDAVKEIRLHENLLDSSSLPMLCELLEVCPNLELLDLRRNCLDQHSVEKLTDFARRASCPAESGGSELASASCSRLVISLEDQGVAQEEAEEDALSLASDSEDEESGLHGSDLDVECSAKTLPSLTASTTCSGGPGTPSATWSPSLASSRMRESCCSDLASTRSPSTSSGSPASLRATSYSSSFDSPSKRSSLSLPSADFERLSPTGGGLERSSPSWRHRKQDSTGTCSTPSLPSPAPSSRQTPSSPASSSRQGGFDWGKLDADTARMLGKSDFGSTLSQISLPRIVPSTTSAAVQEDVEL